MNIFAGNLKKSFITICALLLGVVAGNVAHAQVLLEVSISGNTVTISSTNAAALATVSSYSAYYGVDLKGFFTSPVGVVYYSPTTNTLSSTTGSPAPVFDTAGSDYWSGSYVGLSLYNFSDTSPQLSFTSSDMSVPAFTGTMTVNLTSGSLPSGSAHGDIVAGSTGGGSPDTVIGSWEMASPVGLPEPSTWLMLVGSIALLLMLLRFRRA